MFIIVPALLESSLSDIGPAGRTVTIEQGEQLFGFFRKHPLFNWKVAHNGCEGRADAIGVLLDHWNIPNFKAWIFGGSYLKKNHVGELKQHWNYHVAPVLPIEVDGQIGYYVIDPATADVLRSVEEWAIAITEVPHSYFCIRRSHWYIFPPKRIATIKWNSRNRQNRKWMIQCLAGINGLTAMGKARLCFNKLRIKRIGKAFEEVKCKNPLN